MRPLYTRVEPLDERARSLFGLDEDLLMEHAALALVHHVPTSHQRLLIVCGPGNNGADGLAAARLLMERFCVDVYLPLGAKSSQAQKQHHRFQALGGHITTQEPSLDGYDTIIDALFGSKGRPLDTATLAFIDRLNTAQAFKIACDIPSGLQDYPSTAIAFRADLTVTMGADKSLLYQDFAKGCVGTIVCASLGLPSRAYNDPQPSMVVAEKDDMVPPVRHDPMAHKGSFGHASVLMGEKGGAALLCALAALNFGAGLVTVVTPAPPTLPPDLMSSLTIPEGTSALALGMGLGTCDPAIWQTLIDAPYPLVIDADLCHDPRIVSLLERPYPIVLTPHPKEFSALLDHVGLPALSVAQIQADRFAAIASWQARYPHVTLLLKGANTLITHEARCMVNPLGSVALAKGGSGDVLAGMICALLAQGYPPFEAACQASLAHAVASTRYQGGNYALTPSTLIEEIRCL